MTFKEKHKLGFTSKNGTPLDSLPLSIKLRLGVRNNIRLIPDWQNKLRDLIEQWVESEFKL